MSTGDLGERVRTRSWYDRIAPWYERVAGPFELPARRAGLRRLRTSQGETALDVGCGPGMTLASLARRVGPDGVAIGVDIAPTMCTIANDRLRERGLDG